MKKTPEQLYQEREKRFTDAVELKVPDRVPIMLELSYFPAKYTGIPFETAYYDYDKWLAANCKTVQDFEPDVVQMIRFFPGEVYNILGLKQLKWPGHGVSPYHTHQFIEGEYMKADEYDAFMDERTDFMLRTYLPRIFGALEPLTKLPPLWTMMFNYLEAPILAESLASPEIAPALEALQKAGRELSRWRPRMDAFEKEVEKLGFPQYSVLGAAWLPFDYLSYHVRGMKGIFLDMFRQPDKLLEFFDSLLPILIKKAINSVKAKGGKRVQMALHRGADGFMSAKQFETFYWPYAKKVVQALIDEGITPFLFLEGDYTSRLEYFLELPKGKVLGRFDCSDMKKAKEVLHGHVSIMGNVPATLLQAGTPQAVKDYCKKLIDVVGKDGGFILSPGSSLDEANPENIKVMVDFTREYGRYR